MSSAAPCSPHSLFSDAVFSSTDLQKRGSEVLDSARIRPVTISRNSELFALLKREQAATLIRSIDSIHPVIELVNASVAAIRNAPVKPALDWIRALDVDETRDMCTEVLTLTLRALESESDWDDVYGAIHAWRETANLTIAGGIENVGLQPQAEIPLQAPEFAAEGKGLDAIASGK
jgi:hypothetical protein